MTYLRWHSSNVEPLFVIVCIFPMTEMPKQRCFRMLSFRFYSSFTVHWPSKEFYWKLVKCSKFLLIMIYRIREYKAYVVAPAFHKQLICLSWCASDSSVSWIGKSLPNYCWYLPFDGLDSLLHIHVSCPLLLLIHDSRYPNSSRVCLILVRKMGRNW